MFIKSISSKIIFWYMLVLMILLFSFSTVLYYNFNKHLYDGLDGLLLSRAEGVTNSIETYWEAERLEAVKDGVEGNVFTKTNNINFIKIIKRWISESSNDPALISIMVQIFDSNGNNIAASNNLPPLVKLPKKRFFNISKGNYSFDKVDIQYTKEKLFSLRLLTMPVIENGSLAYIV